MCAALYLMKPFRRGGLPPGRGGLQRTEGGCTGAGGLHRNGATRARSSTAWGRARSSPGAPRLSSGNFRYALWRGPAAPGSHVACEGKWRPAAPLRWWRGGLGGRRGPSPPPHPPDPGLWGDLGPMEQL